MHLNLRVYNVGVCIGTACLRSRYS